MRALYPHPLSNQTKIFILFLLISNNLNAGENLMILKLKDGDVKIELFADVAPNHVERIKKLAIMDQDGAPS